MSQHSPAIVKFEATLAQVMPSVAAGFPMSIPPHKLQRATDRLMFAVKAAAVANGKIYDCTASSVAQCICLSAITGLLPGGAIPVVDLIPRNKRVKGRGGWGSVLELSWQIGWRGYQALGERCGVDIEARLVYKTDKYDLRYGLNPDLIHVPNADAERSWDNLQCAYVIIRLPNGRVRFTDLTKSEIEKRRDNSMSWSRNPPGKRGPWEDWPLEMALKTIIRYSALRGMFPMDEEFTQAVSMEGYQDTVVIDVESTQPEAPAPEAKALEAQPGGMGALDNIIKRNAEGKKAPVELLHAEQSSPERQVEPAPLPEPAGEPDPHPSVGTAPATGGDSHPGPSGTQLRAMEQRISPDVVADIRRDQGIRSNANLANLPGQQRAIYMAAMQREYDSMYPEG